ncbi:MULTISPECIES: LysM peptidoglycan-binding domain-containing protein [Paenarthrobacter]|uniref:LysM peptidoglycan-binding domain-containing protein n=1 Tax=Paenarthrobacter ureafaciens TaxID=37931 RepID=A0AAX3EMC7_PAEUR|nr:MULTISPECIES: LysM peptidoglycan-binding domain-containing protein [Paenarthrobacter]NKR12061.1 peptidoglycan-binding protein [Arthrobacter sp. M5]NKR18203.1 peptidoglycan-binding protein [Arthrobacter sp. M6]OEH57378.1 peptidoglycan-binding protein [Arthrobacter sp. D2]OEH65026.1 peptidoglycan-binding protein [Arthrobacter sp. D4]MDO5864139.1 LysM peptidoglycan-binding domain-containing protein [Paenarthrobacter sp. SD-2]
MSAVTFHDFHSIPAPARIRLTRRGRMVFFGIPAMLLVAAFLSLAGFLNSPAKASDSQAQLQPPVAVSVTVQPGQSLWGIAGAAAPERDPRDVIAEIIELNDLRGGRIQPGQQLLVPAG